MEVGEVLAEESAACGRVSYMHFREIVDRVLRSGDHSIRRPYRQAFINYWVDETVRRSFSKPYVVFNECVYCG